MLQATLQAALEDQRILESRDALMDAFNAATNKVPPQISHGFPLTRNSPSQLIDADIYIYVSFKAEWVHYPDKEATGVTPRQRIEAPPALSGTTNTPVVWGQKEREKRESKIRKKQLLEEKRWGKYGSPSHLASLLAWHTGDHHTGVGGRSGPSDEREGRVCSVEETTSQGSDRGGKGMVGKAAVFETGLAAKSGLMAHTSHPTRHHPPHNSTSLLTLINHPSSGMPSP